MVVRLGLCFCRKVKDGATTFLKWAGAVAGVALLGVTATGTGGATLPAALATATAAFNSLVLGSTVFDAATGRNHTGFDDAAIAAIGTLPGARAGVAWAGKEATFRAAQRVAVTDPVRAARLNAASAQYKAIGDAWVGRVAVGNATCTAAAVEHARQNIAQGGSPTAFDLVTLLAAAGRLNLSRQRLAQTR